MAATTSASSSCSSFFNTRCSTTTARPPRRRAAWGHRGCGGGGRLDGVGMWVVNGFAAAFFASLERLSCIRIATHEDEGDDAYDAVPLIHSVADHHHHGGGSRRRFKGKAFKKESSFLED